MYSDAKQLIKVFNTSLSTLLEKEKQGKFPKFYKMVKIDQGTTDKKIWLTAVIDNFIDSIVYLNDKGYSHGKIAEKEETTVYFVKRALESAGRNYDKTSSFHLVLQTSSQLNRGL
jgi:hypothetical protein